MTANTSSTRRSFLKDGALLAAVPLAAAVPAAVMAGDGLQARLARLEDEAAIRELHQNWLRQINSGTRETSTVPFDGPEGTAFDQAVRSIAADHAGPPDAIEVAAHGQSAAGRFPCAVEIETTIEEDSTLAQMAREQGGGIVRRTERGVLKVEYVKASGAWAIAKAEFASA